MGRLTTHVLDTMRGSPAGGMRIELYRLDDRKARMADVHTNDDGRCDSPLLQGAELLAGEYELRFHVGEYYARADAAAHEKPFLDVVPVRFSIGDANAAWHVPLLVTPWSYTTYRGS